MTRNDPRSSGKRERIFGAKVKKEWRSSRPRKFRSGLQTNLFSAIRLLGSRVRSRGRQFISGRILLVARDSPPAILILRQLAHLRAMFHAALVRAMAVAQRRRGSPPQRRGLIRESRSRDRSEKDCRANRLTKPAGFRFHLFILKPDFIKSDSASVGKFLVFRVRPYRRTVPVPEQKAIDSKNQNDNLDHPSRGISPGSNR